MAARFNTVAAVVRGAAGPADYTPVALTDQKYPHLTTSAHELALAVVYESGILHFADKHEGYRSLPAEAKEFLKKVPAAWDESRLIDAVPGELFIVARKKDGRWFIAGINGKNEVNKVSFKFPETITNPVILTDSEKPADLVIRKSAGNHTGAEIEMKPRGGFVVF